MVSLPAIPASPTVIPAIEEKTYDKYRFLNMRIIANNPLDPIVAIIELQKARILENGIYELSPIDVPFFVRIDDLMSVANQDNQLAQIMGGLIQYIGKIVDAQLNPVVEPQSPPEPEPEPQPSETNNG